MESVADWTREHFLGNQEACQQKLKSLSVEDKAALRANLLEKRNGKLCLLSNAMVRDIQEPELYCESYEVKSADGSSRKECGKYLDKFSIGDNETADQLSPALGDRQIAIVSSPESLNKWVKELYSQESQPDESQYIVKIYEDFPHNVNAMIEVIGFYFAPSCQANNDNEMEIEESTSNDLVEEPAKPTEPSIHAVIVNEIPHCNPLLVESLADKEELSTPDVQKDLLKLLTQFSFGDELAAQYILLHLISRVYGRVEGEILGKFSINLVCSSIPSDILTSYGKTLYALIELLVPNSVYLPLTIENINTKAFVPKKDYKTNRLQTGLLQLPNHSHLMLDETQLANGKLNAQGLFALQDLKELITTQQLQYDFQFYKLPFNTDIPTMTISEGKSMLPTDFTVTIKPDPDSLRIAHETFEAGLHFVKPKLNSFRRYISDRRHAEFSIGEIETKTIENDFVKMRGSSKLQLEDLHSLLVVSRLIGISKGESQFDSSSWEAAKLLEAERSSRFESLNVKK